MSRARRAGVVLCGGRSSRMGAPKHLLTLQGRTFLDWCLSAVDEVVDEVVVSIGQSQDPPSLDSRFRIVADERPLDGPLGGVATSFQSISADAVAVVSCDAPLIAKALIEMLFASLENSDAAVATIDRRIQYFPGVYRRSLATKAERLLEEGTHAMGALLIDADVRILQEEQVLAADPGLASFRNVNTPEDYHALVREFGGP